MSDPVPNGVGARPADRYGTQAANRPAWLLPLVALVVLLAGAGVAYLGFQKYGPAEIEAEELGYTVVDDETVRLRFKVTRTDPATPVVCFVRAMDRDTVEVGRREVLITGSEHGTVEIATEIRTSSRPSSGSVYGCSATVPEYLKPL
ncbi:MAG TPA: DUF4307 domain-containing protein [Nocardia sp.]|uniref:DUF4307 domain-containing protein n=1 Tax=Nocardia TaxID=1817 RepID=UPI00245895AF|nr:MULTISPECIES: DUF4307 domain-containing protein [Nocardia]HLS76409.1 DUF4307 domain-containing protein [Nocardia sp.]